MTLKDWLPIVISLLSLSLSIYIVYITHIKPAKVKMIIGDTLHFVNSYTENHSGKQWGGLSFYLPITFYNWSNRGGEIRQVRMILGRPDNPLEYFDMVWANFAQIAKGEILVKLIENEGIAQPIALSAQSSLERIVRFNWNPYNKDKIGIKPGQYELLLFGWTQDRDKDKDEPDLKEAVSFLFNEDHCKEYQIYVEKNLSVPIPVLLGDSKLPNNLLTKKNIFQVYGRAKK